MEPKKITSQRHLVSCCHAGAGGRGGRAAKKCCQGAGTGLWIILGDDSKKIRSQRHLVSCCHAGAGGGGGGAAKKCCQGAGTGLWIILGDDYWQKEGLSSDEIWRHAVTQRRVGGMEAGRPKHLVSLQAHAGTGPWRTLGDDYWIISRICHS